MPYVLDDSELSISLYSDICCNCAHWNPEPGRTCRAFPDGIPLEIWNGQNDHTKPYPGDRGIQFRRLSAEEEAGFDKKLVEAGD